MTEEAEVVAPEVETSPAEQEGVKETAEAVVTNETGEATDTETADELEATEPEEKPESRKNKRVRELVERAKNLEAERDKERQARANLEAQMRQAQQQTMAQQWQTQKPDVNQFDSTEDWAQAYESWRAYGDQMQQRAQYEQQMAQQQMDAAAAQQARLADTMRRGAEKHADFQAAVSDPTVPSLAQTNSAAYEAVMDSDHAADLAYHLAKHPDEVLAMRSMTPMQAIKTIARLEARITAAPAKAPEPPPKPPSTVKGAKATTAADKEPSDIDDWMKWRTAQLSR